MGGDLTPWPIPARTAGLLAADEAGGITGQGINVCGGTVMD